MKIGLIFPNRDRRYKTVHLGLGYIVSYARQYHPDVEFVLLDTRIAGKTEIKTFFNTRFDLIGITVFCSVFNEVIQVVDKIRKTMQGTPVCLGGPYVTTIMEEIFEYVNVDFAVYGEGEVTFSELIDSLKCNKKCEEIDGLMFQNPNSKIVINPPRDFIRDLDSIPFPAYDIFKMNRYPLHRLATSRGCPYACAFCNASSIWNTKWRKRSAENVFQEINLLVSHYGKKNFAFNDNSFNIDRKRVEDLCDLLIKNKTGILWSSPMRVEKVDDSLAIKMRLAGCYNTSVGIESASNEILLAMNKQVTIEEITTGIRACRKAGIEVMGQFVIGSPNETFSHFRLSLEYARKSELDYVNFYTVLPFKGTPQWNYVQENGTFLNRKIHEYYAARPRIVFVTKEFDYQERLTALRLVKKEGFNSNRDTKSLLFDLIKDFSVWLQKYLPFTYSTGIYMFMKKIYKIRSVKRRNI